MRRRVAPGPRQLNPYSCIDSFFPTGDKAKDMLTLQNTIFNAQIRAINTTTPLAESSVGVVSKIQVEEEESKISTGDINNIDEQLKNVEITKISNESNKSTLAGETTTTMNDVVSCEQDEEPLLQQLNTQILNKSIIKK